MWVCHHHNAMFRGSLTLLQVAHSHVTRPVGSDRVVLFEVLRFRYFTLLSQSHSLSSGRISFGLIAFSLRRHLSILPVIKHNHSFCPNASLTSHESKCYREDISNEWNLSVPPTATNNLDRRA